MFECEPAEFHYNPIGAVARRSGLHAARFGSGLRRTHDAFPPASGTPRSTCNVRYLRPITHCVGSAARDRPRGEARPAGDLHRGRTDGCRRPRRRRLRRARCSFWRPPTELPDDSASAGPRLTPWLSHVCTADPSTGSSCPLENPDLDRLIVPSSETQVVYVRKGGPRAHRRARRSDRGGVLVRRGRRTTSTRTATRRVTAADSTGPSGGCRRDSVEIELKFDADDDTPLPDWTALPGVASVGAAGAARSRRARYSTTRRRARAGALARLTRPRRSPARPVFESRAGREHHCNGRSRMDPRRPGMPLLDWPLGCAGARRALPAACRGYTSVDLGDGCSTCGRSLAHDADLLARA